jgi:hypothetical protein
LKTIFGPVQITRMSYSHPGAASIHPLDEVLQLPARSFSYELQKRIVKAAVQGTFRETRERIAEITGAPVHTRSVEEVIQDAAEDFDAFYVQRDPPPWADTGSVLVAAVDWKGIPMIKPVGAHARVRLTKGQKETVRKWLRWLPCLRKHRGSALRSKWWKVSSARTGLSARPTRRPRVRSTSVYGPA